MSSHDASPVRRRWLFRIPVLLVFGLLLVGLVWLALTAKLAHDRESSVQHSVSRLRADVADSNISAAERDARAAATAAHSAHRLTTGPAWWLAAKLPWLGRPAQTVRVCAAQGDLLGQQVLNPLVGVGSQLELSGLISHGSVRLAPFLAAQPVLDHASTSLRRSTERVDALPHHTWLPAVDSARTSLQASLTKLSDQLTPISQAADVLPGMLGQAGTRRYFVGLENEAESRGVGGIPGAFAIVTATNGKIAFQQFESDTTLDKVRTNLNLGTEYAQLYRGADPANTYVNSTISPDFSKAARIWAAMWQSYSGQRIDGAVAIDPTAIGYLLKVTGAAPLPGGGTVSASNVVSLTQKTLYRTHPDTAARKQYLLQIADAISVRLLQARGSGSLIRAAAKGASERRLLVWAADPAVESRLSGSPIAGALRSDGGYFAGFTTVNATGGKLDYYLARTMSYHRGGCTAGATSTSTFTLRNAVPAGPLPAYVTIRADHPSGATQPGDNRVLLSYYGTPGSRITGLTIDGTRQIVAPTSENGLVLVTVPVELPRGATRTIVVTASEPARSGRTSILRQPAVQPVKVQDSEPTCG